MGLKVACAPHRGFHVLDRPGPVQEGPRTGSARSCTEGRRRSRNGALANPTPDKINGAGHGAMRSPPRLPPRPSNVKCPGLAAQPSPPAGIMSQRICIASAFVAFAGMSGISGTLGSEPGLIERFALPAHESVGQRTHKWRRSSGKWCAGHRGIINVPNAIAKVADPHDNNRRRVLDASGTPISQPCRQRTSL
jgi:hypothetical protein